MKDQLREELVLDCIPTLERLRDDAVKLAVPSLAVVKMAIFVGIALIVDYNLPFETQKTLDGLPMMALVPKYEFLGLLFLFIILIGAVIDGMFCYLPETCHATAVFSSAVKTAERLDLIKLPNDRPLMSKGLERDMDIILTASRSGGRKKEGIRFFPKRDALLRLYDDAVQNQA